MTLPDILSEIITSKQQEVLELKKTSAFPSTPLPSQLSFKDAIAKEGSSFIFEYKKASPSRGSIRPKADLGTIAKIYDAKADAISVLTDNGFFGGSFEDLSEMRAKTQKPLLAKDFFIDDVQVTQARIAGADAILLMLSVLNNETYVRLAKKAKSYNMDVLTEVHDEDELNRAIDLGSEIIGINNRNLRDLTVSLETTRRISPKIPLDRLVVSESGYMTRSDIRKNAPHSDAFLIGSAVMASADVETKINELIVDQVKVCGLTRAEDARLAADLGARFGGLIFTKVSPRYIPLKEAQLIVEENRLDFIGVFLNQTIDEVLHIASELKLSAVQLHGDEDATYRKCLKAFLPNYCKVIQAVRVQSQLPKDVPEGADYILLDTFSKTLPGGTGEVFNWDLLKDAPYLDLMFLSGGLSQDNITNALDQGTLALDLNSHLESEPGIKCHLKMSAFFEELKASTKTRKLLEMAS